MIKDQFQKLSGAGNTFGLIAEENLSGVASKMSKPELARRVSAALKSDGVLFLTKDESGYTWGFYNNDGSEAEMCGNAARCAGLYVHQFLGINPSQDVLFHTIAGEIHVSRRQEGIYVAQTTPVQVHEAHCNVSLDGEKYAGVWVDSGVPHFVIEVKDLKEIPREICRKLRIHPHFGAPGANVTLLKKINERTGDAVTYERGVEDFTPACGTGALASAKALSLAIGQAGVYKIKMPGGQLEVDLSHERPLLIGPAILISSFEPPKEFFL